MIAYPHFMGLADTISIAEGPPALVDSFGQHPSASLCAHYQDRVISDCLKPSGACARWYARAALWRPPRS